MSDTRELLKLTTFTNALWFGDPLLQISIVEKESTRAKREPGAVWRACIVASSSESSWDRRLLSALQNVNLVGREHIRPTFRQWRGLWRIFQRLNYCPSRPSSVLRERIGTLLGFHRRRQHLRPFHWQHRTTSWGSVEVSKIRKRVRSLRQ